MRKRLVCGVLCCVVLLFAASTAAAAGPRAVTGGLNFENWGLRLWMMLNAREVSPDGEAQGWWRVQIYREAFGWRRLDGRVVRLAFDTFEGGAWDGDPVVSVLVEITRAEGWRTEGEAGDPKVGEYGWFWFHDGGLKGDDHMSINYYSMDPWKEYWPAGEEPASFPDFDPFAYEDPVAIPGGNLTIHGM